MNKSEFLSILREKLNGLPPEDIEKSLDYYSEIIDDRIEEGMTEEDAVKILGTPDEIRGQIIHNAPLAKIIKENVKPKRKLKPWETTLLIVTSPIWITALFAIAAAALAIYATIWAVIISFYAIVIGIAVSSIASLASAATCFYSGDITPALFFTGAGLFYGGIDVLLFVGFTALAKGILKLSKKIVSGLKRLFIKRREA